MEISFENVEPSSAPTTASRASQNTILPSLTYSTLTLKKTMTTNNSTNTMECGNGGGNLNSSSQQQPIHHGNIILLRGARAENGQIILQNRQDLLSLLNDDSNNSIVIQQAKLKTNSVAGQTTATTTTTNLPTVKTVIADDGTSGQGATILLQTPIQESWNAKLKKSSGCQISSTAAATTTSVPFLLQTIKRLDNKSQSILVFRNSSTATATAAATLSSSSNKSTTTTSAKVSSHFCSKCFEFLVLGR